MSLDSAAREAIATRFNSSVSEFVRRLESDPEVAGVAVTNRFPGDEAAGRIEVEAAGPVRWVWMGEVDTDVFTLVDVPILVGRGLVESDAARGSNTVIVDDVFANHVLGGGNVLGRRVWRPAGNTELREAVAGPWLEIVGVVPAFTPPPPRQDVAPKLYRPVALADAGRSIQLAILLRPGTAPAGFLSRVRENTHSIDPTLQLSVQTASEAGRLLRKGFRSLALAVVASAGSVLLLSAAGIYAMMSFTVATRRREIGIRIALGAGSRSVLSGIFRGAVIRLGAGVLAGLLVAEAVPRVQGGSFFAGEGARMLPVIVAILVAVGLLASFGPARRVLAVDPTEALRED